MALLGMTFNANLVEPQRPFDPVPDGWYPVIVTQSALKPTKNHSGEYIELGMKITEGTHANRMIFARLNIKNENPVAAEIGQGQLSAICHATGVIQLEDTQQLHGIPFEVKVVVRPASNGYEASNDVKAFRKLGGAMAPTVTAQRPVAGPTPAPTKPAPAPTKPAPAPAPVAAPAAEAPAPAPTGSGIPPWQQQ